MADHNQWSDIKSHLLQSEDS